MTKNGKITINMLLTLDGKEAENFERLRENRGLKNNTELLRLLVREAEMATGIVEREA